jgi:hypothetical protein
MSVFRRLAFLDHETVGVETIGAIQLDHVLDGVHFLNPHGMEMVRHAAAGRFRVERRGGTRRLGVGRVLELNLEAVPKIAVAAPKHDLFRPDLFYDEAVAVAEIALLKKCRA